MQAHDQDELRRQAQRALTRRITAEPERKVEAPPERERPRDRPSRPESSTALESTVTEPAERQETESASPRPTYEQETMARPARRPAVPSPAPRVARSAYDIAPARRSEIYRMLHSRASLRQALVVSEILGKPKALRETSDPENFGAV